MNIISFIPVICFYLWPLSSSVKCTKFDSNRFERKLIALAKIMRFVIQRPEQMNIDTTLGVTFAAANIEAAIRHKNVQFLDTYQKSSLENVLKLIEDTHYILREQSRNLNEEVSPLINRPEIWIRPIFWKKMNLNKRFFSGLNSTLKETITSMFKGHPQEYESDLCLKNLIRDCQLTSVCRNFILHDDNCTTGYPLTHKLLLMQTLSALQCEDNIRRFFPYLRLKICSLIFQDLLNIEAKKFPNVGKDLASEQVFLCGMEGYLDFLNEHFEQLILDWQHPSGCYSGIGYASNFDWDKNRLRRSATFTDFDCVNHATGLAAAALALMIRKDVELLR